MFMRVRREGGQQEILMYDINPEALRAGGLPTHDQLRAGIQIANDNVLDEGYFLFCARRPAGQQSELILYNRSEEKGEEPKEREFTGVVAKQMLPGNEYIIRALVYPEKPIKPEMAKTA